MSASKKLLNDIYRIFKETNPAFIKQNLFVLVLIQRVLIQNLSVFLSLPLPPFICFKSPDYGSLVAKRGYLNKKELFCQEKGNKFKELES